MDWRAKVDLFEQIRREYEFGVGTIKGVARKLGVHRRMVRDALKGALPPERKRAERVRPSLAPVRPFIDGTLEADRKAPRKQRHTAHRIYVRIRAEFPDHTIAESTVRGYVRGKKLELGLLGKDTFVPQSYTWGQEAQVDWYEAEAELGDERQRLQVFCMRSMGSAGGFHRAYLRATQQAFLEGHDLGFRYFGGVFRVCRYDNLRSAVKEILRGKRREETARFVAFRSHWKFEADFCTPGAGHEKGGVEGEQGYFRRNHWVPVPRAESLEALNEQLLASCRQDEARRVGDRALTVGAAMAVEREHLLPIPDESFELAEASFPIVDGKACVKVRTNFYSTPVRAGTKLRAVVLPATVEVWHEGNCVARHERSYGRQQKVLNLEHYLDVLERKPGALAGSTPLEQWRQQGRWPASYDRLWAALRGRHGKQEGTREMIQVIMLGRDYGYERLRQAIERALDLGCSDPAAIRYLVTADELERVRPEAIDIGILARYERPLPVLADYNQLLSAEVKQ
jgi:transposase